MELYITISAWVLLILQSVFGVCYVFKGGGYTFGGLLNLAMNIPVCGRIIGWW